MSMQSPRQLLEAAQVSGLITVANVDRLGSHLDTQRISTLSETAAHLVQNQTLTQFQIEQLLSMALYTAPIAPSPSLAVRQMKSMKRKNEKVSGKAPVKTG